MRQLIPLFVFVVLITFFAIGLTKDPRVIPSPLIGQSVPLYQLKRLLRPENEISTDNFMGSDFVLNVWASWCAACLEEHHLLMKLSEVADIPIVGLNYKDSRNEALQWWTENGNPYLQTWFDPQGKFGIELGVYGVPETFFIDKNGIIRHKHIGPLDSQTISAAMEILKTTKDLSL